MLISVLVMLLSCSKQEKPISEVDSTTLNGFLASLPDGEILRKRLPLIDNSALQLTNTFARQNMKESLKLNNSPSLNIAEESLDDDSDGSRIRVRVRWPGTGNNGNTCEIAIGLCVIIPLSTILSDTSLFGYDGEIVNSVLTVVGSKLLIEAIGEETGLTSDGYLPIPDFMPISSNLLIKPGVYKAKDGKVIVDLYDTKK